MKMYPRFFAHISSLTRQILMGAKIVSAEVGKTDIHSLCPDDVGDWLTQVSQRTRIVTKRTYRNLKMSFGM
jgi:hypothetical protein